MRVYLILLMILTYGFNIHCKQAPASDLKEEIANGPTALKARAMYPLDEKVEETSGLIYFDNSFWTINDSGNSNILYKIDSKSGSVLAEVRVNNSENVDWEELTQDEDYIYIADIGDNALLREEKQVYRVKKSDLLKVENGAVDSEVIRFNYPLVDSKESRYDAEAMVSYQGSLHVFTKDLFESNHFVISAKPGKVTAKFMGKFRSNGQVTGAALDSVGNSLVMVGYLGFGQRLLWEFKDVTKGTVLSSSVRFFSLGSLTETGQVEAVCFTPDKKICFSNEGFGGLNQQLWNLSYPID